MHSMVSEQTVLLSRQFWILSTEYIQSNLDAGLYSCGVFIDLKKAVTTVYEELSMIGSRRIRLIGPRLLNLKLAYLAKGKQFLVFLIGPLLFLIYINDIYRVSSKLNFYLFADDTNILYANNNLKSLESVVNEELRKVCEWLNTNKLSLNTSKSNFVIFIPFNVSLITT